MTSAPRIVIIGETFRSNGGGGITMMNLFKEWPSDKLAVITELVSESSPEYHCTKYYQIGHLEKRIPIFLRILKNKKISGERTLNNFANMISPDNNSSSGLRRTLRSIYHMFVRILGLNHIINRTVLSDNLVEWVKAYNPEVIYHQPFRFSDMSLAFQLKSLTKLPLVLHVMDDIVSFINKPNLLYPYWQQKIKRQFKTLVNVSSVCLSISDSMSDEYQNRYNKTFLAFRNPVDFERWSKFQKSTWQISHPAKIIYTGRLVPPNVSSLLLICRTVSSLRSKGNNIILDIYSLDDYHYFSKRIKSLSGINLKRPVSYDKIPLLLAQYDIAILPIDFNKRGIRFAKFSISTKTSEYLASGVPVLLLTPAGTALDDYGKKTQSMLVVNEKRINQIEGKLMELINDESLRKKLARNAIDAASKDSDAEVIRNRFSYIINSALSNVE
jgi:glycosyltransferase involved in cell wall biosynthesis